MCNIAGYLGEKQAAPILLEMLRRQAPYDGDMSTGVATIHEGKLYYRKMVGDVDTFLREVDLSELPGTVGIAHTRPAGTPGGPAVHPTVNKDQTIAMVTNGTSPRTSYWETNWDAAADRLQESGYEFRGTYPNPDNRSPKLSRSGELVHMNECKVALVEYYMAQGKTMTEAMALSQTDIYNDNVSVFLNEKFPDSIFAIRNTRPMNVILEKGETYMATTRYAFPEELKNEPMMLPVQYACQITRESVKICGSRMNIEPVMEMTPYTYGEAYKRFERILKSGTPVCFDDLEHAVGREMRDLWPGDHTFVQHARLVYDMLWQFDTEGRLKREMRIQNIHEMPRHRWYFWLEE